MFIKKNIHKMKIIKRKLLMRKCIQKRRFSIVSALQLGSFAFSVETNRNDDKKSKYEPNFI